MRIDCQPPWVILALFRQADALRITVRSTFSIKEVFVLAHSIGTGTISTRGSSSSIVGVRIVTEKVILGKIGAGNTGNFTASGNPVILLRRSKRISRQKAHS
jgi:hypothetical protein